MITLYEPTIWKPKKANTFKDTADLIYQYKYSTKQSPFTSKGRIEKNLQEDWNGYQCQKLHQQE